MMGYFGRLHVVPVGVLGEENSAPQYVRALLVQEDGVGFWIWLKEMIEPHAGDHSNVFNVTRTFLHGFPFLS